MSTTSDSSPAETDAAAKDLPEGNLIVFDGICVFCSGFARFMAKHDRKAGFRFVDAHSPKGRALYRHHGLDPDRMETNIVLFEGRAYTRMASFTAAMRSLGWPWRALTLLDLLPDGLANWIYDRIAQNRYRLGRRTCPLPSADLKERLLDG
ncbi:thiol-disulfide oxidoreductase DCC family protein [Roseibium sp. Sym1]|uniref:thiol-disulfide oxidoreductase DCC family protein n=1 Tax=Roseibium sp. Sym1 TaxID=3016006 RepID=UPI0022B376F6|nr:DCC1-like thiol-disulfide oxidoreductase family protein [Roseibium sp. Sym1]